MATVLAPKSFIFEEYTGPPKRKAFAPKARQKDCFLLNRQRGEGLIDLTYGERTEGASRQRDPANDSGGSGAAIPSARSNQPGCPLREQNKNTDQSEQDDTNPKAVEEGPDNDPNVDYGDDLPSFEGLPKPTSSTTPATVGPTIAKGEGRTFLSSTPTKSGSANEGQGKDDNENEQVVSKAPPIVIADSEASDSSSSEDDLPSIEELWKRKTTAVKNSDVDGMRATNVDQARGNIGAMSTPSPSSSSLNSEGPGNGIETAAAENDLLQASQTTEPNVSLDSHADPAFTAGNSPDSPPSSKRSAPVEEDPAEQLLGHHRLKRHKATGHDDPLPIQSQWNVSVQVGSSNKESNKDVGDAGSSRSIQSRRPSPADKLGTEKFSEQESSGHSSSGGNDSDSEFSQTEPSHSISPRRSRRNGMARSSRIPKVAARSSPRRRFVRKTTVSASTSTQASTSSLGASTAISRCTGRGEHAYSVMSDTPNQTADIRIHLVPMGVSSATIQIEGQGPLQVSCSTATTLMDSVLGALGGYLLPQRERHIRLRVLNSCLSPILVLLQTHIPLPPSPSTSTRGR